MEFSIITSVIAAITSIVALLVTYSAFIREKNKSNQDLLFHEKITAYKELSLMANKIFNDQFSIVNKMQDHEGTDKQWQKDFVKTSHDYYLQTMEFRDLLTKYMVILPNEVYEKMENLSSALTVFVTSSHNKHNMRTFENYDRLSCLLVESVQVIRKDLNVEKLNIKLNRRLD